MKNYFYYETKGNIFNSLRRYFKYVLNSDLILFTEESASTNEPINILVLEDEKNCIELLNRIKNLPEHDSIILGYNDSSLINLLNARLLREKMTSLIMGKIISRPHFSAEELKTKLNNFFKGHGEESIFQVLTAVIYCLQNYEFYALGNLTNEEYIDNFVNVSKQQWEKYILRFNKYKIYLDFLGYGDEILEIYDYCNVIDEFIKTFDELIGINQIGNDNNLEKVKINLGLLKKIDYFLTKISNELGLMDAPLQGANS